jgi:dipeptidyl aminopeptidase/acylaminoacyl peptidase
MKTMIITLLLAMVGSGAMAQGTVADYRRADSVRYKYSWKVANSEVKVHRMRDGHKFWYSVWDGRKMVYKEVDADSNKVSILNENPEKPRPQRRQDRRQHYWSEVPDEKTGWQVSPVDSMLMVFHRDNNLWTRRGHDVRPLTTDGDSTYYYSAWGSFSPDGRYYATVRIKPAPKHYVYYVESVPGTTSRGGKYDVAEPVLHKQEYAKPGDSLNYRVPVVVEMATGRVIEPSTELFYKQYSVSAPRWDSNSRTLTFTFNERGHKTYRLLELDALTGTVRTIIEETNAKYVNYNRLYRHDFKDGRRILWTSERDGRNHIYLYDRKKENFVRQVTKGEFYVREIQYVDEKAGVVYFSANGMNKAEDPYLIHYYRIGLNGKNMVCLTPEEGHHEAVFSDDMQYVIDTYSTIQTPPVTVLRRVKDGKLIRTLERADITRLKAEGWQAPEVFVAAGRDGNTPMWGIIMRPSNFAPTKKYPIIEYIYSGPGDQYVPKSFTPWIWGMAELAELGFIVVQLDAMTTSFRTREFEEVCYKNLKDGGLPDRKAWIRAAAEKYPYMDIDRVGIYGCSAGGQNAMAAVLWHGDFYKAAYAACGCHDNRMDKIWWNEQWMSYPVDSSYVECSNVANAYRLERPLMLVVGELDDNVDPASTMQVVSALQKAGKDFELVVLPGAHHTMGDTYGNHKRNDFFVRHLMGKEPPKWSDILDKKDRRE